MITKAWHKKLTHFISLTSPLPASRQSSRATKNSSRSVLYQTYNREKSKKSEIDYNRYLAQQHILDIKLSTQYNWQCSNLFFRRLHTLGHLQPSTLLCHHVHLRSTESYYKNQQSVQWLLITQSFIYFQIEKNSLVEHIGRRGGVSEQTLLCSS